MENGKRTGNTHVCVIVVLAGSQQFDWNSRYPKAVGVEHINATSTNHVASVKVVQVTNATPIAMAIGYNAPVVGNTDLWATKIAAGLGLALCISGAWLLGGFTIVVTTTTTLLVII